MPDKERTLTDEEKYQLCRQIINAAKKVHLLNGGKDIVFVKGNYTDWEGGFPDNA